VHCQVYKGRCDQNPLISRAASLTAGLVILGQDSTLITAAFHSNCGGETENSENVWLISKPYLRSVNDVYCQNQHNSKWEVKMELEEWKKYLKASGFKNLAPSADPYIFNQVHRKVYYKLGKDSIPFRKIREDLKLKSAFFSVTIDNDKVILKGKGYGHGIGLCQEGAMQMSKFGRTYEEIIHFYYQNVKIVNYADFVK
jgi:stage II sporulation protein D